MRTPSGLAASFGMVLLLGSSGVTTAFAQAPSAAPAVASAPAAPAVPAPPAALAGPRPLADTLEGDAKRQYEIGRLLYDNGDYAGALARFESAHTASADPRLLWNEAVCQKALHHYAKAIAAMRSYLASSSPLVSATGAASARNFLAAAEPLTARLEVYSNVSGAIVYADGDSLGRAPLGPDARIDWGSHQIVVKRADYTDYEQTVSVSGSADVRVAAVLRRVIHAGRIIVRAGSGDAIALDGTVIAWGTWEGVLASGSHVLRVSAPGFRTRKQPIVVADGQTRGFDITLERAPPSALPAWVWLTGGALLLAGAASAGYFIFKPAEARPATEGSIATVRLALHPP